VASNYIKLISHVLVLSTGVEVRKGDIVGIFVKKDKEVKKDWKFILRI
jgi:hypothetical protein